MSIQSFLKSLVKGSATAAVKKITTKTETFRFTALPADAEELKALPEAALTTPFQAAALTVCALCAYEKNPENGIAMLNFLKGPQPLTPYEKQFLHDRFAHQSYVPVSYFDGAAPSNNYTPSAPYTLKVSDNPYSYDTEGYTVLWLTSGGADSPRQVKLRKKGNQWFLWEQFLLTDIRKKNEEDPWA